MSTFALPGNPEMPTLFLDGGTNTAALVAREQGTRRTRHLQFADAHAGLDYCIGNRYRFVYLPAPPGEGN